MSDKKNIGNVNVLDIRKATEASVSQIGMIGNANVVLYSAETANLLSHLNFGNLNVSAELPGGDNVQMLLNKTTINHDYFGNKTTPEFLAIMGKVMFEGDVTVDDIAKNISGMVLMGKIICPENLMGVLQSKSKMTAGKIEGYPHLSQVMIGDLLLDESGLNALPDQSEIAVVGSVTFPVVVPDQLIERKLARLYASGGIKCHEENAPALLKRLHERSREITTIPAGYEWIEQPILLDDFILAQKAGRKLFCSGKVQIDAEVSAAALDGGLSALISEDGVICPSGLKEVIARKCDLLKTKVTFYDGRLWIVENEQTLLPSFLEALEGKLTLMVSGCLKIAQSIEPKLLADKLAKVHNEGLIQCNTAQMGVLQLRMGKNDGAIEDISLPKEEEPKSDPFGIGNANYLAL
jgi:hypothetical protein